MSSQSKSEIMGVETWVIQILSCVALVVLWQVFKEDAIVWFNDLNPFAQGFLLKFWAIFPAVLLGGMGFLLFYTKMQESNDSDFSPFWWAVVVALCFVLLVCGKAGFDAFMDTNPLSSFFNL